jgi:hypothetical protein
MNIGTAAASTVAALIAALRRGVAAFPRAGARRLHALQALTFGLAAFGCSISWSQQPAAPGPFGLRVGMSRAELGITAFARDGVYSIAKVPQPDQWYERFTVLISPSHGLCQFTAFHTALERLGPEGVMLWNMMNRSYNDFSKRLGPPSRTEGPDFSKGRILDATFVDDLVARKRKAGIYWDNVVGGSTRITHLAVEGHARDARMVYTTLTIQFSNSQACTEELASLSTPRPAAAAPSPALMRHQRDVLLRCHAIAHVLSFGRPDAPDVQRRTAWRALSQDLLVAAKFHSDAAGEAAFSFPSGSDLRVAPHFKTLRDLHLKGSVPSVQEAVACSRWRSWVPGGLWLQMRSSERQKGSIPSFGSDVAAALRYDLNDWWNLGIKANDTGPAQNLTPEELGSSVRNAFRDWEREAFPMSSVRL